ncbi:hypothetical protein OHA72_45720 [Dactylosporangium sp. NBC_01737]|uniref:hypothetical protein n=1 Tax=Dactylosporangium sp. NBC_01737 TaxID=2975959 RepID=UPI002E11605A|nr:hypothetical protein OHA72_45720 [Dactylosporangium sp. NBC_01737]
MAGPDLEAAGEGRFEFYSSIWHQGTVYPMVTVLRRDARAGDRSGAVRRDEPETVVAGWPALAAAVLAKNAPLLAERCDADVARTASPFAVTPPLGRRIEVLDETPATLPADPQRSAETDVELRPMYRRLVRDLRNG